MSKETIYREDAIYAIRSTVAQYVPFLNGINMTLPLECETALRSIPSADRPQGEWIDEADEYDASFGIHDYRCSNCNSYADEYIGGHEWYTAGKPNFCPYCGADMRERKESE